MTNDGEFGVSGADTQASYARFIQAIKAKGSTYAATGSNDVSMVKFRKEANAQGVNTVKVWACSVACYTPNFLQSGGKDVEGTYVWLQFLPFEDAGSNATLDAYLAAIGGPNKGTSWGASAWAAADEFKAVVDQIVAKDGPNGVTRAKFLAAIKDFNGFDDNGFIGPRDQRKYSDCMVMMQVQNGKFVRVQPTEKGKFDCNPKYLTDIAIDPSTAFKG
jgi:ABC-type branched-subunit amino acid transport system substrate-binding protein